MKHIWTLRTQKDTAVIQAEGMDTNALTASRVAPILEHKALHQLNGDAVNVYH
jgi:hypothetical protein